MKTQTGEVSCLRSQGKWQGWGLNLNRAQPNEQEKSVPGAQG